MLKKVAGFVMIPNRIFELNLDTYEIAVFVALKKCGKNIFPGYSYLTKSLRISRGRLKKSLKTLKDCNVITWDRGMGKSNIYAIFGEGVWVPRWVTTRPTTRSPQGLPLGHQVASNNTNRKRLNKKREGTTDFISLLERIKNRKDVVG